MGAVSFGGPALTGPMFVVKLDSSGTYQWGMGTTALNGAAVVTDGSQNVFVSGVLDAATDFGGGAINGGAFLLKLADDGSFLWNRPYGAGATLEGCFSLTLAPTGEVVVVCSNKTFMNFGNGALPSAGMSDFAIAKIASK
jgi:hypothetical protein